MDTSSALPEKRDQRKWSYLLLAAGCVLLVTAFLIGISDNPPGIVLMLAGFLAVVLGIVYRFARSGKRKPAHQLLYWAPRALCIVIAVFISMFALDVFGEGEGFLGDNSCPSDPSDPNLSRSHPARGLLALGMDWRDFLHPVGNILRCVGLEQAIRPLVYLPNDCRTSCIGRSFVSAQLVLQE